MAELVYAMVSNTIARKGLRVRVPLPAPEFWKRGPRICGRPVLYFDVLMDIQKSLSQLGERITRAREDLRIVEEQLLFQMDVLEEAKTRMLVAETPLADREFRVAREDHDRLVEERKRVNLEIEELQREQDRLLDRMLASPPV